MGREAITESVDQLIREVDAILVNISEVAEGQSLRDKVLKLCDLRKKFSELGVATAARFGCGATSARERIRLYLIEYVGEVIDGSELAVISGITDYQRRIRELRVEHGYQIYSSSLCPPGGDLRLGKDQYLLAQSEPNREAADRWAVSNRIRRSDQGSRASILEFLLNYVGEIVTTEELAYVSNDKREFARRVRELRTEEGYPIATRFTGRPDLKSGQYTLALQNSKRRELRGFATLVA